MTRDEIEKMPAGPAMNELIATVVMGWEIDERKTHYIRKDGPRRFFVIYGDFLPSEDIAAAWFSVDEMRKKGYAFYFEHQQDDSEYPLPFAMFSDKECNALSTCVAETAPLAICRAELMAVMK